MNKALQAARAAAAERKQNGIKVERLDPIQKAQANPTSKALAIRAKCWDCVGAGADANPRKEIRECKCSTCPLHPVRPFQISETDEE